MFHQELAKLLPLGDLKIHRLIQFMRREINRAHQVGRGRRHRHVVGASVHRQQVKLPRLTPVDHAQAFFLDLLIVQIDRARHADVLLHPRIFHRLRVDAEKSLGQVPKGPVRHLLNPKNMLHLALRKHALLHEQLTDLNPCWHDLTSPWG
jgi:hypothetical protein